MISLSGFRNRPKSWNCAGSTGVDLSGRYESPAVGSHQCVRDNRGVGSSDIRRIFREQIVPDDQPRSVQLGLALRSSEEPDVHMRAAISDAVDMRLEMPASA
jgi:hypothetical protein